MSSARPLSLSLLFRGTPGRIAAWLRSGSLVIPVAASLLVLLSGCFPVEPVRDAATLGVVPDVFLDRPDAYVDLAPFSDVLDAITLLSERQHVAVLLGLMVLWCLWRLSRPRTLRWDWRGNARSFAILLSVITM